MSLLEDLDQICSLAPDSFPQSTDHPDAVLCVETVGKLSERYGIGLERAVFPSDCGATYTSLSYRKCLKALRIRQDHG